MKSAVGQEGQVGPAVRSRGKSVLREYVEAIVVALLLALTIRTFIVQAFKIPSGSMIPTLLVGDHILVGKFIYGVRNPFSGTVWIPWQDPARGDIVVFRYPQDPSKDYIKRVVGVGGDKVEIQSKKLFVNGKEVVDPRAVYLDPAVLPDDMQPRDNFGPVTVPAGSIFVMGDNRDNSHDSRFWGFVDQKALLGKAWIIYWSWDSEDFGVRWPRLGRLLQ